MTKLGRSGFNIFILDDDEMTSSLYAQHLLNEGYNHIRLFKDEQSCLDALTEKPHVIFIDQLIGKIPGVEVLKKIKRFDPNIYVVVFSGQDDMEIAMSAMRYGAFDYIIKGKGDLQRLSEILSRIRDIQEILSRSERTFPRKLFSLFMF